MNKNILIAIICLALFTACKNNNKATPLMAKETGHAEKMTTMFTKPKVEIKTIGILLYDGYFALDAMGPYSVFNELMGVRVFFVGRHKGVIEDSRGMKVQVDTSMDEVKQLDLLVIPGGFKQTYEATKDTQLLTWIKSIDSTSIYTSSVCTGAWILGATGLLKNKEATTHWYGKKILADSFGAKVQNTRYTHSGKYWTGAGVTAGLDMSLAMVNEIMGEKYTKAAMLDLEYDPKPIYDAGSETKTDKDVVEMMRTMYDDAMEKILHPELGFKEIKFDNTKDFSCGMPLSAGVSDTAHFKRKVYGFCSTACKEAFKKNPDSYLATK